MKRNWSIVIVCATIVLIAGIGAYTYGQLSTRETITVKGTAKKLVTPDRLMSTITLTEISEDQVAASKNLETRVVDLQVALQNTGIDTSLLTQGTVTIAPYFDYTNSVNQPQDRKQISQTITLRLDKTKVGDLGDMSKKITNAITALNPGVNNYYFNYDFVDRDKVSGELRSEAVKNAQQKAVETLSLLNARAGRVVSVNDEYTGGIRPWFMMDRAVGAAPESTVGSGFATSPQEQEVEFSVNVTYQIQNKLFGIW